MPPGCCLAARQLGQANGGRYSTRNSHLSGEQAVSRALLEMWAVNDNIENTPGQLASTCITVITLAISLEKLTNSSALSMPLFDGILTEESLTRLLLPRSMGLVLLAWEMDQGKRRPRNDRN